jgi:protein-disulfide isomerase
MSKRREIEAREDRVARTRNLQIAGIIGFLAVTIIGGAALFANRTGTNKVDIPLPSLIPSAKAVPASVDGIAWGPKDAPIKIEEFIDYQCPGCKGQWSAYEEEIVAALPKTGKVRYELNFLTFLETRAGGRGDSTNAANAAMCAADQGKFFEMHNTLFGNQIDENSGQFGIERLKNMGKLVKDLDTAKFDACVDAGTHKGRLQAMAADAETRQVSSTPAFFVNGKAYPGSQSLTALRKIFSEVAPSVKVE